MPPCPTIYTTSAPKLTGRFCHRRSAFLGRMILQVEERFREGAYRYPWDPVKWGKYETAWRDATPEEAFEIDLRGKKPPAARG